MKPRKHIITSPTEAGAEKTQPKAKTSPTSAENQETQPSDFFSLLEFKRSLHQENDKGEANRELQHLSSKNCNEEQVAFWGSTNSDAGGCNLDFTEIPGDKKKTYCDLNCLSAKTAKEVAITGKNTTHLSPPMPCIIALSTSIDKNALQAINGKNRIEKVDELQNDKNALHAINEKNRVEKVNELQNENGRQLQLQNPLDKKKAQQKTTRKRYRPKITSEGPQRTRKTSTPEATHVGAKRKYVPKKILNAMTTTPPPKKQNGEHNDPSKGNTGAEDHSTEEQAEAAQPHPLTVAEPHSTDRDQFERGMIASNHQIHLLKQILMGQTNLMAGMKQFELDVNLCLNSLNKRYKKLYYAVRFLESRVDDLTAVEQGDEDDTTEDTSSAASAGSL